MTLYILTEVCKKSTATQIFYSKHERDNQLDKIIQEYNKECDKHGNIQLHTIEKKSWDGEIWDGEIDRNVYENGTHYFITTQNIELEEKKNA